MTSSPTFYWAVFLFCLVCAHSFVLNAPKDFGMRLHAINSDGPNNPSPSHSPIRNLKSISAAIIAATLSFGCNSNSAWSSDDIPTPQVTAASPVKTDVDYGSFKIPYFHENIPVKEFLGKATIVTNMKLDDPQTPVQYPNLIEVFKTYEKEGLHLLVFPTEQGYFEPDDDETCRGKSKEYFNFDSYPNGVVFDKVDLIGPSAHPFYVALTEELPTPNGYSRITLNWEKFLLDEKGHPLRRYPRKFSAYDMEADIKAALKGEELPPESPEFKKAWREAKREAMKSEYAFRLNYNYYNSPDSMYKYDPEKDR